MMPAAEVADWVILTSSNVLLYEGGRVLASGFPSPGPTGICARKPVLHRAWVRPSEKSAQIAELSVADTVLISVR